MVLDQLLAACVIYASQNLANVRYGHVQRPQQRDDSSCARLARAVVSDTPHSTVARG